METGFAWLCVCLFYYSLPGTAGTHLENLTASQSCYCVVKYIDCWLGSEDPKQKNQWIFPGSLQVKQVVKSISVVQQWDLQ